MIFQCVLRVIIPFALAFLHLVAHAEQHIIFEEDEAVAVALAPIKNKAQLERYLKLVKDEESPLQFLSEHSRKKFIESLTFHQNGGLTGYRYPELQSELTPTQIYNVLALFGAQRDVRMFRLARQESPTDAKLLEIGPTASVDYYDYRCTSRANCRYAENYICRSDSCNKF
jgi:hypothetical protein